MKKTNNKNDIFDSLIMKCECNACAMEIARVEEVYKDKTIYKSFEISLWKLGCVERPLSWRERCRWIWRILRTGNPWADSIILSDEKAKRIVRFIQKYV